MKIVIVDTTLCGPVIGGAQTFLPGLMKGLIEKGNEVHLVTIDSPDKRVELPIQQSGAILYTNIWKKSLLPEDAVPFFAEWVNKLQPDVYLISVSADIGWLVLPLLTSSIVTLTIGHTDDETFYAPARHYHSFLTKVIGVSDTVCESYNNSCHIPLDKIEWIPYGVTINPMPPDIDESGMLKMVYVGRLEEAQKRISDLSTIAKKLSEAGTNYQLTIIGDGPEMSTLQQGLTNEIKEKRIILTGWLAAKEVISKIRNSEVFVLTSAYEGFCIALIEAMANGCCPVVTNIRSGNKQLIQDKQNGFFLEIGDTEGFVKKLQWLQSNKTALYQLRKKAWQTGRHYSVSKMVDTYENSFLKAVAEGKKQTRKIDSSFPLMESCRSPYPLWLRRLKQKYQRK